MSKPIEETERCKLFEQIADSVWKKIIRAHNVSVDAKEVGITADILVEILEYNESNVPNFNVYVKPGWEENTYGSDLDIFIETSPNEYRWFALQAKILKTNNRYTTLRDTSDGKMQWEKLKTLERLSGCKAYHLLYNGRSTFKVNHQDQCDKKFSEAQYGCSLVEPTDIEKFASIQAPSGRYMNPIFEDIHPSFAQPWRILTCCYHNTQKFSLYSLDQIKKSNSYLKLITELNSEYDEDAITPIETPQLDLNNPIASASQEAEWDPGVRLIIRRTDSLNE